MAATPEAVTGEVLDPQPVKPPNVPIGPSTIAGYSVTLAAVILAVLAFVQGDRSEQTLGTIVAGAVAGVAFVVTQVGRYLQSRELAKGAADANRQIAAARAFPPRMLGVGSTGEVDKSLGDPDNPLREHELSDDEIRGIVGPGEVEDPATDPER